MEEYRQTWIETTLRFKDGMVSYGFVVKAVVKITVVLTVIFVR